MANLARRSGEKLLVSVDSHTWKQTISDALVYRKIIETRDVADIVAMPVEDYLKSRYIRGQPLKRKLSIYFFSVPEPPFRKQAGFPFVRTVCNIPDVKREVLDWNIIKTACGGNNGYRWGRFRATANLSNGRKMAVYGSSESSAELQLRAFAKLSEANITALIVSEEKREGLRAENKTLFKASTRVYPGYFTFINEQKIVGESMLEAGLTGTLVGNFKRQSTPKIPLWVTKEPKNVKALITEALKDRSQSNI